MHLDIKRDKIQREAENAWANNNCIGTCELTTGSGKTITALHGVVNRVPLGGKVLFLAETNQREIDFRKDIINYKKYFNIDVELQVNFTFSTYQSAYKWKNTHWDMVIADEIHFSLSKEYVKFYRNNKYDRLMGLSATLNDNVIYEEGDLVYSKKDLLKEIAPICYTYNINQSQSEGTSRKIKLFVINHYLERIVKDYEGGTKAKPFMQSEQAAYDYYDNQFKRSLFIADEVKKTTMIRLYSQKRAKVLYSANSKVNKVKQLLAGLNSKTLVFGNDLDAVIKVTSNTVSSRNSKDKNEKIRKQFEQGKINTIGSFKLLEQGANLNSLDNIVMMSYYGKSRPIVQRIGRIRVDPEKHLGYVFIFKTIGTQEEKWFNLMMEDITDFEIISCSSVEDALIKYNKCYETY